MWVAPLQQTCPCWLALCHSCMQRRGEPARKPLFMKCNCLSCANIEQLEWSWPVNMCKCCIWPHLWLGKYMWWLLARNRWELYRANGTVPLTSKLSLSCETRLVSHETCLERNERSLQRNEMCLISRECTGSTNTLHSSVFKTCFMYKTSVLYCID